MLLGKLLKALKERTVSVIETHWENDLCTMRVQLLDHICKHLVTFESIRFLNASVLELLTWFPKVPGKHLRGGQLE